MKIFNSKLSDSILNYIKLISIIIAGVSTFYVWTKYKNPRQNIAMQNLTSMNRPDLDIGFTNFSIRMIPPNNEMPNTIKCIQAMNSTDAPDNKIEKFCEKGDKIDYLVSFDIIIKNNRKLHTNINKSNILLELGSLTSDLSIFYSEIKNSKTSSVISDGKEIASTKNIEANSSALFPVKSTFSITWCCGNPHKIRAKFLRIRFDSEIKNNIGTKNKNINLISHEIYNPMIGSYAPIRQTSYVEPVIHHQSPVVHHAPLPISKPYHSTYSSPYYSSPTHNMYRGSVYYRDAISSD